MTHITEIRKIARVPLLLRIEYRKENIAYLTQRFREVDAAAAEAIRSPSVPVVVEVSELIPDALEAFDEQEEEESS